MLNQGDPYGPAPSNPDDQEYLRRLLLQNTGQEPGGAPGSDPYSPQSHGTRNWGVDGHGDPLGPGGPDPSRSSTQGSGKPDTSLSSRPGGQPNNSASSGGPKPADAFDNVYQPQFRDVPQRNIGASLAQHARPGSILGIIGALSSNENQVAAASAANQRQIEMHKESLEEAKGRAQAQYYRNLYGSGAGANRSNMFSRDEKGVLHALRYDPVSGGFVQSEQEAVIPQVETQESRNTGNLDLQGARNQGNLALQGARNQGSANVAGIHQNTAYGVAGINAGSRSANHNPNNQFIASHPEDFSPEIVNAAKAIMDRQAQSPAGAADKTETTDTARDQFGMPVKTTKTTKHTPRQGAPAQAPPAPAAPTKQYTRTGTRADGKRVGQLPDGRIEVIQ